MAENRADANEDATVDGRIEILDGLRFVAALSVMLFHYGFRTWNSNVPGYIEYPLLGNAVKYGYLGVDLFFMISGFVILMSASRGNVAAFLHARFVRLYPAYWFCVITTFAFLSYFKFNDASALDVRAMLINLTMLQQLFNVQNVDSSYWTLVIELNFYAILVLVLWMGQIRNIDKILALWLVAGISADFVPRLNTIGVIYAASWCHYFIAGAMAYRMRIAGISVFRTTVFGVAFIQAARHAHWFMGLKQRLTYVTYDPWMVQIIVALIFALFILMALGHINFRHSWLSRMGALTYPLYLIHGAIGSSLLVVWVHQYEMNRWVALSIVSIGAIASAWLIHRYIELPVAARLRIFIKRWQLPRPVA